MLHFKINYNIGCINYHSSNKISFDFKYSLHYNFGDDYMELINNNEIKKVLLTQDETLFRGISCSNKNFTQDSSMFYGIINYEYNNYIFKHILCVWNIDQTIIYKYPIDNYPSQLDVNNNFIIYKISNIISIINFNNKIINSFTINHIDSYTLSPDNNMFFVVCCNEEETRTELNYNNNNINPISVTYPIYSQGLLIDIYSGKIILKICKKNVINRIAFSPDGKYIIIICTKNEINIYPIYKYFNSFQSQNYVDTTVVLY